MDYNCVDMKPEKNIFCWLTTIIMMMVSQHCANIGPLDKTPLAHHWLANVGPTLACQ